MILKHNWDLLKNLKKKPFQKNMFLRDFPGFTL